MKIDVFLIGVQKAGTSSLYDWVSQHPEINAPILLKDYHYWISPKLNKIGWSFIEKQFKLGSEAQIKMLGGVNYIYFEEAPKILRDHNPNAKLLLVLRNPIKRALSAHAYFSKLGQESLSFSNALKREETSSFESIDQRANWTYLKHGLYSNQIERYLKYYNRDQLHILFFEELIVEKEKVIKEIFKFLQIDHEFVPVFNKVNETGAVRFGWVNRFLFSGKGLGKIVPMLSKIIPFSLRIKFGNWIREVNRKTKKEDSPIHFDQVKLENYYYDDLSKLSSLLDIDLFDKWNFTKN